MPINPPIRRIPKPSETKPSEQGYALVWVVFMLALMMLALTAAAPRIAKSIQRDREVETMRRGKQYSRAVKLYYKKFGRYPPNVDALVKTNEIRFLRKKYLDPMTGKDDWKPIPLGQNKTQSLGFFGQPIAGSSAGGLGPSGPNGITGGNGIGGPNTGGSNIGGQGTNGALGSTGTTDNGTTTGQNGTNGSTDTSGGNGGSGTDGSGQNGGIGANGQTFGGVGIMGFKPGSPKQSILLYKKKNHYNEWEFFYDPVAEQLMQQGAAGSTGIGGTNGTNGAGGIGGTGGGGIGAGGIGGGGIGGGGIGGGGIGPGSGTGSGGSSPNPPQ